MIISIDCFKFKEFVIKYIVLNIYVYLCIILLGVTLK